MQTSCRKLWTALGQPLGLQKTLLYGGLYMMFCKKYPQQVS